jgi:hypothetical protein
MYMALSRAVAKIEKQALKLKKRSSIVSTRAQDFVGGSKPDGQLEATPPPVRIIAAATSTR